MADGYDWSRRGDDSSRIALRQVGCARQMCATVPLRDAHGTAPFLPEIVAMRLFRTVCLAGSLFAAAATAHAQGDGRLHYLHLVNRAHDSVTSLAVADAGSGAFRDIVADPLRGGGDSATVGVAGAGCRYDLRFGFSDGRTLVYNDLDVCRNVLVRIRPLPRRQAGAPMRFVASMGR